MTLLLKESRRIVPALISTLRSYLRWYLQLETALVQGRHYPIFDGVTSVLADRALKALTYMRPLVDARSRSGVHCWRL